MMKPLTESEINIAVEYDNINFEINGSNYSLSQSQGDWSFGSWDLNDGDLEIPYICFKAKDRQKAILRVMTHILTFLEAR